MPILIVYYTLPTFLFLSLGSRSTLDLAQRSLTAVRLPEMHARCSGDDPKLSGFCGSKPEYTSICKKAMLGIRGMKSTEDSYLKTGQYILKARF